MQINFAFIIDGCMHMVRESKKVSVNWSLVSHMACCDYSILCEILASTCGT